MGNKKKREILDRLERLERVLHDRQSRRGGHDDRRRDNCRHEHHRDHGDGHDGRDRHRGGRDFDEKRVIDTIVHLVSERVGDMVREGETRSARDGGAGSERRIVDLVVNLVAERVEEIVEEAFERYLAMPMDVDDEHVDCGHDHEVHEVTQSPAKRRKAAPSAGAAEEE